MKLRALGQRYLSDLVLGANDGVITTLAVVSGVVGAGLSTHVILILGFANLVADGFSMAASNLLSRRSSPHNDSVPPLSEAAGNGAATFLGFVVAGLAPLLAYLVPLFEGARFEAALALALTTLFAVGAGRALFSERRWFAAGLEMLLIGAAAGLLAYAAGALGATVIAALAPAA